MLFGDLKLLTLPYVSVSVPSSHDVLQLTKRGKHNGQPIPMAGIPHHSLDTYLSRFVKKGLRVRLDCALCTCLVLVVNGIVVRLQCASR